MADADAMQGFGSRRLMANPRSRDKCASDAASQQCALTAVNEVGLACQTSCTTRLTPLIGEGEATMGSGITSRAWRRRQRPFARLLAFGAEFLALLAVKALGVGFLGAFERGGGARLLGHCRGRCRLAGRQPCGGRGGLRERASRSGTGTRRRSRPAREDSGHHGSTSG